MESNYYGDSTQTGKAPEIGSLQDIIVNNLQTVIGVMSVFISMACLLYGQVQMPIGVEYLATWFKTITRPEVLLTQVIKVLGMSSYRWRLSTGQR